MIDEEIDDDHAMHCVLWLTGQDQQALIDSLVETIDRAEGYEGYTARDVREMAAKLCALGSGLLTHRRSPAR